MSAPVVTPDTSPVDLIVHGHFYQPPREDPWTEEIEGEPSAAPFANWNERIHAECYRPNAHSRILGEFGRIRAIANNYSWLSFNFGPTLLSWMERYDPETLGRIVRADGESIARNNGHGNAIAQSYNHMIMPLADERDRETQILWGLEDFRMRFGREPEAMWMPETAVDLDTLAMLLSHGMKYAILSPFQCAECQTPDGKWQKISDGKMDTARAYIVKTAVGPLPVFFYHGPLSADVSFNHILRSSEGFFDRILASYGASSLITIATDGEIYGHHEPFGDMCVAHAYQEHLSGRSGRAKRPVRITNYAHWLERNPVQLEAKLKPGASSWSCSHGVERWRSDCGCRANTANGWNQQWRKPLREGLDALRDALRKVYETEGAKVMKDPWTARNEYVRVILAHYNAKARAEFAAKWFRKDAGTAAWQLLESQRNAMLMFTSCGWFFDDISGIEPRQLMLYASRAIDALGEMKPHGLEDKFVKRLKDAKSNDPHHGDGEKIYREITHPRRTAKLRILSQAILSSHAGIKDHGRLRYAVSFEGEAFWNEGDEESESGGVSARPGDGGGITLGRGTARVKDTRTDVEKRYAWVGRFNMPPETLLFDIGATFRWPGGDPRNKTWAKIRPVVAERKGCVALGLRDLFRSESKVLLQQEARKADRDLEMICRNAVNAIEPVLEFANILQIPADRFYIDFLNCIADFVWTGHIRAGRKEEARHLEHRLGRFGIAITHKAISQAYSAEIDRLASPLALAGCASPAFDSFLGTLRAMQDDGAVIEARLAQEVVYALLKGEGVAMIGSVLATADRRIYEVLLGLLDAAQRLYLEIAEERKLLDPFEQRIAADPNYWP